MSCFDKLLASMPLFEPGYLAKQYWFLTWYGYLGYEESY
jgi:hypothetical protein